MIVVVGLGNIGLPIAARILECGRAVCGVDIAAARRDKWRSVTGQHALASVADVPWPDVTYVLIVVRLSGEAENVLQHLERLPVPARVGVFVHTTLELGYARDLQRYADRGVRLVELPVSGGAVGARAGRLTIMSAGALTDTDEELLRATIAEHVVRFGAFGEPTLAKLLNNVTAAYNALSYAEMMLLAHDHGMAPGRLADVVHTSSGGSWMGDHFVDLVDDLLDKDVRLLRDQLGSLPVISLGADQDLVKRLSEARSLLIDGS
jgi:3-hydroxyisobutyrate dehydrogenase